MTALLLAIVLLACDEKPLPARKPTPNAEVPEVPLVQDKPPLLHFDKGFISKPMYGYELASSYEPRIFSLTMKIGLRKMALNN